MDPIRSTPQNCVWELTMQCNMRCLHCGSRAGFSRGNELSVDEALKVADQLILLGCRHVSFIGGEIFLYKDWHKVARRLTANGLTVNININGFLFVEKQIEEVNFAGLSSISISIDGMEENNNLIRRNSLSFTHIQQTLNRLNAEKIDIGVITTLWDRNVDDLEPLYHFLLENNVKTWQLQLTNPMGNFKNQRNHQLSIENIEKINAFIHQKRQENKILVYTGDNIGYYDEHEKYIRGLPGIANYWSSCQAGLSVIGIDSVGNVKGCDSLYDNVFIEGNIRKESLVSIWFKDGGFAYNRNFDASLLCEKCSTCDMGVFCRAGCRSACYFAKGKLCENTSCTHIEECTRNVEN